MKTWVQNQIDAKSKKALPVLSFPGVQLINITVDRLISSADNQANCLKAVADSVPAAAAVSFMDLSVEAECFGSKIKFGDNEVPTVTGSIVSSLEEAEKLEIPQVGGKRTKVNIEAIRRASKMIADRPLFAGVIGPFSLAGRLCDVTEAMIYCYEEPEMMRTLVEKCATFIQKYILSYKEAGANGVIMAEPLAGILSPDLAEEFSVRYVREIIKNVQDDNFIVLYHNCGNSVPHMLDRIITQNAAAYHFGNAVNLSEILKRMPQNVLVMGNINPVLFKNADAEAIRKETLNLLEACGNYPNFIISSGCDIPPSSKWENIKAFFETVSDYYK